METIVVLLTLVAIAAVLLLYFVRRNRTPRRRTNLSLLGALGLLAIGDLSAGAWIGGFLAGRRARRARERAQR